MQSVLKIDDRFLKPGTEVFIGPTDERFKGVIFKSYLTLHCDQSTFIQYDVEWWDERVVHREVFHASDLEVCDPID